MRNERILESAEFLPGLVLLDEEFDETGEPIINVEFLDEEEFDF